MFIPLDYELRQFINGTVLAVKSERKIQHDIHEVARYSGCLTRFLTVLDAANLTSMLKGTGPITVFAPSDRAFESLPAGSVERLLKAENRAELINLLKNHVISGELMTEAAGARDFLGNPLRASN
jgi:uncharacterized surface protein with fasciclin (FAS1) repeats